MSDDEGTNAVEDAPSDETRDDAADASGETDRESGPDELVERAAEYDEELAADLESVLEQADRRDEDLDSLEERLAERKAEVDDLESRLKRKQADFQNYKKRAEKRRKQVEARATEDLVSRLVGVRDDLQRAVEEGDDAETLREGVEMTLGEFDRVLEEEGVSEIRPEPGSEVDPQRHEVMVRVESDQPEGTIEEVFAPGYEMGDKVIQSAQVTVSDGSGEGED